MKIFLLNVLLFISPMFYAQDKEDNSDFKQYSSSIFNSKETALSVVSSMNKKSPETFNNYQSSTVLIQQIGDFNKFNATLQANETYISAGQNGDGNELFINKKAESITQKVIQQGDNNKITDFTLNTSYNVNTEMFQNGDNQSIQNVGTNSISKNMKITQKGNGASIIVINK